MKVYYAWSFFLMMMAYLPLFLILSLVNFSDSLRSFSPGSVMEWISLLGLLVSAVSAVVVNTLIRTALRDGHGAGDYHISKISSRDKDVVGYLVSYVVPLATIKTTSWFGAAAFIIILVLVLYLSLETDIRYINPLMFVRGVHFYVVQSDHQEWLLISRERFRAVSTNLERSCVRLARHDVLIDRGYSSGKRSV